MVPKVMIILGSASDKDVALKSIKILEKLQIPYSLKVASAHRTHDKVKRLVIDTTPTKFCSIYSTGSSFPFIVASSLWFFVYMINQSLLFLS